MRLILFFLLMAFVPHSAMAKDKLIVGVPCLDVNACGFPGIQSILREAYSRTGTDIDFKYLPMLRDLVEANDNIIDATMSRTREATAQYPNLIAVPFPFLKISFGAVTTKPGISINSWEDLKTLKVGILRGNMTPSILAKKHHVPFVLFNNYNSGLAMLKAGRLDVILAIPRAISAIASANGIRGLYYSSPLYEGYTFHFLHKRHSELALKLGQILQKMLEESVSQKLVGKHADILPSFPIRDLENGGE